MPSLIVWNRKTHMGGDDLQPSAAITILFRMFETFLLIPIILHMHNQIITSQVNLHSFLYPSFNDESCATAYYFPSCIFFYTISCLLFIIMSVIFEWYILKYSSIGTPTQEVEYRNKLVSTTLEWKYKIITAYEILLVSVGSIGLYHVNVYYSCIGMKKRDDVTFLFLLVFMVGLQCVHLFMSIMFIVHLLRLSTMSSTSNTNSSNSNSNRSHSNHDYGSAEDMWQRRCDVCCRILSILTCCLFGGKELFKNETNGLYSDIARILTDYFEDGGVLDLVVSDVIAGLVMLQREQKVRQYQARRKIRSVRSSRSLLSDSLTASLTVEYDHFNDNQPRKQIKYIKHSSTTSLNKSITRSALNPFLEIDRYIMAEGTRYVRFALAIYTWMLYVYMHPCTSCCSTCKNNEQEMRRKFIPPIIIGDNKYNSHRNAFLLHLNKKAEDIDIIYAQFSNGIVETPYAIVLDHTCKSIVITIRGSLSLEDCVIDAMPDPISLEKVFPSENKQYCHSGIYTRTMWIYEDIQQHDLLHYLTEYNTYIIRVVGHSLGAGCAALLSLMLRKQYPNLRCLCYSPPGGLFSYELAVQCSSFTTSFVLDSDLVPRLSVENMEYLRNDVLSIISRISVPKLTVLHHLVSGVSSIFFTQFTQEIEDIVEREESLCTSNAKILYSKDDIPDTTFSRQYQQFQIIQAERKQQRLREYGTSNMKEYIHKISLHPPGTIIHLVKTGENSNNVQKGNLSRCIRKCLTCGTTNVGSEYSPIYIHNNDLNEILVSPTMGTDHFPDRVCLEIEKVFERQFCTTVLGDGEDGEIEMEIEHLLNCYNSVEKIDALIHGV